jgi:hypothetical protein
MPSWSENQRGGHIRITARRHSLKFDIVRARPVGINPVTLAWFDTVRELPA